MARPSVFLAGFARRPRMQTVVKILGALAPCVLGAVIVASCGASTAGPGSVDASPSDASEEVDTTPVDGGSPGDDASQTNFGPDDADASDADDGHHLLPADASRIPVSHRASTTCPAHPASTSTAPACTAVPADSGLHGQCATDNDCVSGINGRCICQYPPDDAGAPYPRCAYDQCGSDNDCSGQVCGCGVVEDTGDASATQALFVQYACVPGQCHADSDCGDGGYCSPSLSLCGFVAEFACHTAQDECVNNSDCAAEPLDGGVAACVYKDGLGYWTCSQIYACPDGGAR
jgi:hypothetical protein